MEILQQHENGTILRCVKTYNELTDEEKEMLVIPATDKIEEYKDFIVDRNKKNVVTRVVTYSVAEEAIRKMERGFDLVDSLTVLYGEKGTKSHKKAKKRVDYARDISYKEMYEKTEGLNNSSLYIIQDVVDSDLSAYRIEDITGVSRATLSNLRNGKSDILNLTFANAIKLTRLGIALSETSRGNNNEI